MNPKTIVYHNGEPKFQLNEDLLTRQNAWGNLEAIKAVHQTRLDIYDAIEAENDPLILRSYAEDITLCEFELQKLWGFPEDAKFHRFWEAPKCLCPTWDNEDAYPTGYYVRVLSCPLHGVNS